MSIKRIIFWLGFIIVLGLIIWGLVEAGKKAPATPGSLAPAEVTDSDNVIGPSDAPVTLIEYSDFQCPACALYHPIVERLLSEASTTVRFVYRYFPLPQYKHALSSAYAAESAANQDKFLEMIKLIFENQSSWQGLTQDQGKAVFRGYAESLGLDMDIYDIDVDSVEVKQKVQDQLREGIAIGVNFTPSFFVNGKLVQPRSYEEFKTIIDTAATGGTY